MKNKKRLGRGLGSIIDGDIMETINEIDNHAAQGSSATEINISEIRPNPYQPRTEFSEEKILELADSIKEFGVFTPVLVKKSVKGYELIAGERRMRASQKAGLKTIPTIIVDYDKQKMMQVALIENIQREQLNPLEEAIAVQRIISSENYTQEQLAKKIGKSRSHISNLLRVSELSDMVKKYIASGSMSMGHIKPLLGLKAESADAVAKHIINEKWTVRKTEEFVAELKSSKTKIKKQIKEKSSALKSIENIASQKLGTKVTIDNKTIKIKYTNNSDLNRILDIINISHE